MTHDEARAKIRDLSGDVADCLSGGLPHDTFTYRGSLLHDLLEAATALAARPADTGLWRCENCGEGIAPGEVGGPEWRWLGMAPQHKCPGIDPQAGHFNCRWFGDARPAAADSAAVAACKAMLATWGSQDEDAIIAARDMARAAVEGAAADDAG